MPQVLLEAFAARLPVVATAVGGVAQAAGGCALLVPPGTPRPPRMSSRESPTTVPCGRGSPGPAPTTFAGTLWRPRPSAWPTSFARPPGAPGPDRQKPKKARAAAAIGALIASICTLAVLGPRDRLGRFGRSLRQVASPDGNDSAPGTADRPYATAQRLVNTLAPGETGCLRAGTYREDLTVATPGVGLTSYPGDQATVAGRLRVTADRVTVERLTLDGRNARDLPSPTINADDVVFRRNDVSSRDSGICFILGSLTEVRHPVIKRNRIHNCGQPGGIPDHGIYMQHVNGARILRNTIYDNAERGIKIGPDSQRALIRGMSLTETRSGSTFRGTSPAPPPGMS